MKKIDTYLDLTGHFQADAKLPKIALPNIGKMYSRKIYTNKLVIQMKIIIDYGFLTKFYLDLYKIIASNQYED